MFAALMAQVNFGSHDPLKHVVGWLPYIISEFFLHVLMVLTFH